MPSQLCSPNEYKPEPTQCRLTNKVHQKKISFELINLGEYFLQLPKILNSQKDEL